MYGWDARLRISGSCNIVKSLLDVSAEILPRGNRPLTVLCCKKVHCLAYFQDCSFWKVLGEETCCRVNFSIGWKVRQSFKICWSSLNLNGCYYTKGHHKEYIHAGIIFSYMFHFGLQEHVFVEVLKHTLSAPSLFHLRCCFFL